ncbi:MAG: hypothetical protein U0Q16_00345 [Bryobacteraceae bacterium]
MHKGLTAQVQYTWAKSIDNALAGGREAELDVAQNWLDLRSSGRGRSWRRRRSVAASFQYHRVAWHAFRDGSKTGSSVRS